jgi:hypothetical protein
MPLRFREEIQEMLWRGDGELSVNVGGMADFRTCGRRSCSNAPERHDRHCPAMRPSMLCRVVDVEAAGGRGHITKGVSCQFKVSAQLY